LGFTITEKSYIDKNDNKFTVTSRFKHDVFVKVFASKLADTVCDSSSKSPKKRKLKNKSETPGSSRSNEQRTTTTSNPPEFSKVVEHDIAVTASSELDKQVVTDQPQQQAVSSLSAEEIKKMMTDTTKQRCIVDWLSTETTEYDVACIHDKIFQGFAVIAETVPEFPRFFMLLSKIKDALDTLTTERVDNAEKGPVHDFSKVRAMFEEINLSSEIVYRNARELLRDEKEYLDKLKNDKADLLKQIRKQAMASADVVIASHKVITALEQQILEIKAELAKKCKELQEAERVMKEKQIAENAKIEELKALDANTELGDVQHVIKLAELVIAMTDKTTTLKLEKCCEQYLTQNRINLEAQRRLFKDILASIDSQITQNKEMSPLLAKTREFHKQQLGECEDKLSRLSQ